MKHRRVLVIGGGVAGASCALRLRQHGVDVQIAEKAVFPRAKVCGCCIGGAGLAALEQLALRQCVLETGMPTRMWRASIAGKQIELPLPDGAVISRESLDTKMLAAAGESGATVLAPCQATIENVAEDHVTANLQIDHQQRQQEFAAVVIASGLNAGGLHAKAASQLLPWKQPPHGPFGVSWTASSKSVDPGVIYMACDDDGYVGLVRLEDQRVDIAAALASGSAAAAKRSPAERVTAILARSRFADLTLGDPSAVLTTPPLRRTRTAGARRVLAIGDAAGYVEPFTGEGMTWAMQSGIASANLIAARIDNLASIGEAWDRRLNALLRRQRLTCRVVTTAIRWPLARRAVAQTLSGWPSLARPLIRSLN